MAAATLFQLTLRPPFLGRYLGVRQSVSPDIFQLHTQITMKLDESKQGRDFE